ncbi:MAG: metallophosphoesterase [Thermoguttaceae bacterium]|nr:metallophosphoesterase [Thermoguttaceae bacterium]MDW8039303.1 metallophosphoesterase [Thermoguttaceae bacterium]
MSSVVLLGMMFALLGHTSFWVGLVNRMHGRAWPESLLRGLSLGCVLLWGLLGAGLVWQALLAIPSPWVGDSVLRGWFSQLAWPWQTYLVGCWLIAGRNLWAWLWRQLLHRAPKVLLSQAEEVFSLPVAAQNGIRHHPLVWLPQNEILSLQLTRREIQLAQLPSQLDGLTLLHLSDLHFTGRVAQQWFRQAMEFCAQLEADLVMFTGDFLDSMDCLDWIPNVFQPFQGRRGVYFILGNHDWRLDWQRIRAAIVQLGFESLGGRWTFVSTWAHAGKADKSVSCGNLTEAQSNRHEAIDPSGKTVKPVSFNELLLSEDLDWPSIPPAFPRQPSSYEQNQQTRILLAGNELPWIGPAPDMSEAPPPACDGGPIRILLAHTPDQLRWARKHQFDLMLAGHTHGGQIRLPLIGPILTPSRTGVRYSGGVFHEPPTVLHVSRGISAEWPLRWNCPPEVVLLVLRSPSCSV